MPRLCAARALLFLGFRNRSVHNPFLNGNMKCVLSSPLIADNPGSLTPGDPLGLFEPAINALADYLPAAHSEDAFGRTFCRSLHPAGCI